ncbi:hypothetical protein Mapa_017745 [Marchantia paleacea]|nr:hypothetical protein Mapa_017745 [Marchantia paleacea]
METRRVLGNVLLGQNKRLLHESLWIKYSQPIERIPAKIVINIARFITNIYIGDQNRD